MSYEYDIFLSYRRSEIAEPWVRLHLLPRLQARLDQNAPFAVRISCDSQIETGTRWPEELKRRLNKSALLVAVWSADYFRSEWCMAEWQSFRERERTLGLFNAANPHGLVYPVRYSDGDYFHPDALQTQTRIDFSEHTFPEESFKFTSEYLKFDRLIIAMAQELVPRLMARPPWQPNFPIFEPAALQPVSLSRTIL